MVPILCYGFARRPSTDASILMLDFPALELWETECGELQASQPLAFGYNHAWRAKTLAL